MRTFAAPPVYKFRTSSIISADMFCYSISLWLIRWLSVGSIKRPKNRHILMYYSVCVPLQRRNLAVSGRTTRSQRDSKSSEDRLSYRVGDSLRWKHSFVFIEITASVPWLSAASSTGVNAVNVTKTCLSCPSSCFMSSFSEATKQYTNPLDVVFTFLFDFNRRNEPTELLSVDSQKILEGLFTQKLILNGTKTMFIAYLIRRCRY